MHDRNWLSAIAPVGVVLIVALMLLATGLVNRQNAAECADGWTATGCRAAAQPGGFAAPAMADQRPNAGPVFGRFEAPAWWDASLLREAPLSLYLTIASLVLIAVTLVVALVVARRQRRLERAQRGTDDGKAVTTERIVSLVETVVTVIRAMEERTRELDASVKALGAARSAEHQALAERLASAVAELGTYQKTLANDFLPSIARRDERLVAIDANLTAMTERLTRLGADGENNARETAALGERFRTLVQSVADLTAGLVELKQSLQGAPARPSAVPAAPQPPQAADAAVGMDQNPTPEHPSGTLAAPQPSQAAGAPVGTDGNPPPERPSVTPAAPQPPQSADPPPETGQGGDGTPPADDGAKSHSPGGRPAGDA